MTLLGFPRGARWLVVAMSGVWLAACGGGEAEPTATPAAIATATTPAAPFTPTPAPDPAIGEIVWTAALEPGTNAPAAPVTAFSSQAPALYVAVRVANVRPETVVTASWTYNGTELQGATRAAVFQSAYEAGWLEFHLMRDPGATAWPAGRYAVTIALDGEVVRRAEIEVSAGSAT